MTITLHAYVNGEYLPQELARISPFDRGFIFGDGVYEVMPVFNGKLFNFPQYYKRLTSSLQGIRVQVPVSEQELQDILKRLIEKNGNGNQWLYLQVTRGMELVRNHAFPKMVTPTIFATSYPKVMLPKEEHAKGIKVTPLTDIRWKYCNIKTIARLAYVLMYQEALDNGFDEAIIIHNGFAIEGTSSNLFIVRHGVIMTPPKSTLMLSGITRELILTLAEKNKIPYRETKIAERELLKADEMWMSSSIRGLQPVLQFDHQKIGKGEPGPLWNKVWDLYAKEIAAYSS